MSIPWLEKEKQDALDCMYKAQTYISPDRLLALIAIAEAAQEVWKATGDEEGSYWCGCDELVEAVQAAEGVA